MWTICIYGVPRDQERVSDTLNLELADGCQLPCVGWKMDPGSPQEQQVLLKIEQSLQSCSAFLFEIRFCYTGQPCLKFNMYLRFASNSWWSFCVSLPCLVLQGWATVMPESRYPKDHYQESSPLQNTWRSSYYKL